MLHLTSRGTEDISLQEWHRVQEVQVQVRNSSEGSQNPSSSWSEAAGLSQEELDRVLKDGPQAARALLTFAEFLLARFARNCLQGVRNYWLPLPALSEIVLINIDAGVNRRILPVSKQYLNFKCDTYPYTCRVPCLRMSWRKLDNSGSRRLFSATSLGLDW